MGEGLIVAGQIGYGRFGKILHRVFAPPNGFCVSRVVVRDPFIEREALQTGANVSSDINDILDDPEIQAVVVAVPLLLHYPCGLAVLQAGKHLFIEKPVTESVLQAKELEREAEARGLAVIVDYTFSFSPVLPELRRLITAGRIGNLTGFYFNWDQDVMPLGRSVHLEISSHFLSILNVFMPLSSFTIQSKEAEKIHRLHISGGLDGDIDVRLGTSAKERRLVLTGTEGSLEYSFATGGSIVITREGEEPAFEGRFIEGKNLLYAIAAFRQLISGTGESNLAAAIAVTRVLENLTVSV